MKKRLVLLFLGVMVFVTSSAFAAKKLSGEKIAYVDLKKVFQEYSETEVATNKLKEEIQAKQTLIDTKKEEVKQLREDYEKKAVVLSDEEKEKKSEEIDAKIKDLQDFVMKSNRELKELEEKLTKSIIKTIQDIITDIGQKEGLKLILDKNERIVLFADEELDITDRVIEGLKS